jgi:hypothetical protein
MAFLKKSSWRAHQGAIQDTVNRDCVSDGVACLLHIMILLLCQATATLEVHLDIEEFGKFPKFGKFPPLKTECIMRGGRGCDAVAPRSSLEPQGTSEYVPDHEYSLKLQLKFQLKLL